MRGRDLRTSLLFATLVAGGGAMIAASAPAEVSSKAVSSSGQVYRVLNGPHVELLPQEGDALLASASILVLQILQPDGGVEHHLVPGTESPYPEASPALLYEEESQTVFLLWEGLASGLHPVLYLTSFDGFAWSELIEITSNPFANKGDLQFHISRERSHRVKSSEADPVGRTIIHVTWWEETAAGGIPRKMYAPIVIREGRLIGSIPVLNLGWVADKDFQAAGIESPEVARLLRLQPDWEGGVILGFLNPETSTLDTVRIQVLPSELGDFIVKARALIIAVGRELPVRQEFTRKVSEWLPELGPEFHVSTLAYIAESLAASIDGDGEPDDVLSEEDLIPIIDKARALIIAVGATIDSAGLEDQRTAKILDIAEPDPDTERHYYFKASLLSSRQAPEVPAEAVPQLFLSSSGEQALLCWTEGDAIRYVESSDEAGWSTVQLIELGSQLDEHEVFAMLEGRMRSR